MAKKLTPKQKLFCYHYVQLGGDPHGMDAAVKAGFGKPNSSKVRACELLKLPDIQAEITRLMDARERELKAIDGAVAFNALEELAEMAQAWRKPGHVLETCHVRAAELYMHNSGQSPEAKKIMAEIYGKMNASEFFGWTKDELEHYASTGQRPARFAQPSGTASIN